MKYKILKEYPERNWKIGEIAQIDEKSSVPLLRGGFIEPYNGDEPHKHIAITVDPIGLTSNIKI